MSDAMIQNFSWLAFGGLALILSSLGALLYIERKRMRLAARLMRSAGNGPKRSERSTGRNSSSIGHWRQQSRRLILRAGERLSVILGGEARETAADLSSAGYRGRDALLIYAFLKTVLPVVTLGIGAVWVLMSKDIGIAMVMPAAKVIGLALALSKGVDAFVNHKRTKRLALIRRGMPDLLELLVISSEAGLGPQPALQRVAVELSSTSPELAQEVLQMVSEMRMTNDRRAAYEKLNTRVPLPEIGVFTQTLDQSDTYGTPFSRAMRTLVDEQRANRLMAVEEKAARLPVIMTLPLIFCIMPAVFVVLIGPAALSVFDNIISGG